MEKPELTEAQKAFCDAIAIQLAATVATSMQHIVHDITLRLQKEILYGELKPKLENDAEAS